MRSIVTSDQLALGIRWENLRAEVLENWGRLDEAADARTRAEGYFLRLQQNDYEPDTDLAA